MFGRACDVAEHVKAVTKDMRREFREYAGMEGEVRKEASEVKKENRGGKGKKKESGEGWAEKLRGKMF